MSVTKDLGPDNQKKVMSERQLRLTMVNVFGSDSEEVMQLDEILHRMWAAEDRVEEGGNR